MERDTLKKQLLIEWDRQLTMDEDMKQKYVRQLQLEESMKDVLEKTKDEVWKCLGEKGGTIFVRD